MGEWLSIEEFDRFQELERLCDEVWERAIEWRALAQDTLGKQLVRALDSAGANLVEGDGRYSSREKIHYCYIARGSLKEAAYWIRRARSRHLLEEKQAADLLQRLDGLHRWINALIARRRQWDSVRESPADYSPADPSLPDFPTP